MIPPFPIPEDILAANLKEAFGTHVKIIGSNALTGGARKKVIRLQLRGPIKEVVLLIWQNEHDYFGERDNPLSERSDRTAPILYKANSDLLLSAGVRVPQLYYFDASYRLFPYAYAVVEYIQGITFYEWLPDRSPDEVKILLGKISDCLNRMHRLRRDTYGTLLDDSRKSIPCHEQALGEACQGLTGLAESIDIVRENKMSVRQKLDELFQAIEPRTKYSFIHDELGPEEHLLIDARDEIVLIDVDGCHFFDLEREYAYLQLRFGNHFEYLKRDDLNEKRMQFYTFCLHITAAYGHYLLYQQGFPDPESLRGIYQGNIQKFLKLSMV
ncbi:MAG: hypothetical protein EHM41_20510 [Chloroflexi bacterium]|nr:MAG: hypothetical protein EHM41_20510 [Chloroflexota bacterium]